MTREGKGAMGNSSIKKMGRRRFNPGDPEGTAGAGRQDGNEPRDGVSTGGKGTRDSVQHGAQVLRTDLCPKHSG